MSLLLTFLHSKIARRISILFVLCALLPISALGVISYTHVTAQLHEQAQQRLRQASKAAGMAVYERLTVLESEMKVLAAQLREDVESPVPAPSEGGGRRLADRFRGIAIQRAGTSQPVFGRTPDAFRVDPDQRRYLDEGKTVLVIVPDGRGSSIVRLARMLDPGDSGRGMLLADVQSAYLWLGGEGVTLPALMDMCVFTAAALPLFCSIDDPEPMARQLTAPSGRSEAAFFRWEDGTDDFLASYWTIPLKYQFSSLPLTVVMSERNKDALAPLDSFKHTFVLVLALALCVVTLLSYRQIHSSLGPLEQLQHGTKRIAGRDFSIRVPISSTDEFGELAGSFNSMAERLGRQFQMLDTLGAVSRAILSSFEPHRIVEVVESRISDALACDAIAVTCFDSPEMPAGTLTIRFLDGSERRVVTGIRLREAEADALVAHPDHHMIEGVEIPLYLSSLPAGGIDRVVMLPIFIQGRCAGFLALGYAGSHRPTDDDVLHARQLADQMSVALSNAREIARRIEADAQAHFLANYDPLTRLANREGFHRAVARALMERRSNGRSGSIALINLDRFQRVNDTFGPRAGDRVLEEVAARVTDTFRHEGVAPESTSTARLGSDQFGLLLPHSQSVDEDMRLVHAVLAAISRPFQVSEQEVFLTASAGIALLGVDGNDPDLLIRNADTAMRAAKDGGRNGCHFYSESMNLRLAARMALEAEIRQALAREEFRLFYQPQVDVETGVLVGVEALIRWQHPVRGLVSPAEFVPIVEEDAELTVVVGEWVLRAACRQQQVWRRLALPPIGIAVNVSALHFRRPDFVERFQTIVAETGADRSGLELELTETVMMNDAQTAAAALQRLQTMGVKLAMDDFGTGYSSLAYLRQFPFDKIKIDRAFINEIRSDSDAAALTSAIIAMGRALNLQVLAEGVETEGQLAFLRERGCRTYQGYLYSKPLSASDITALLGRLAETSLPRSA